MPQKRTSLIALSLFITLLLSGAQSAASSFKTVDFPGAVETQLYQIDTNAIDGNLAVGYYLDQLGVAHGFLWTQSGTKTSFDFPGAAATYAYGINAKGNIAGWYVDSNGVNHGYVYDSGKFITIDPPNSSSTQAWDINYANMIVGTYFDSITGQYRGFTFFRGVYSPYDVQGAAHTELHGLSHGGASVGMYIKSNGVEHGFVLGGKFIELTHPGSTVTSADRIARDDSGNVVGSYADNDSSPLSGFGIKDANSSKKFITVTYPGATNTWVHGLNSARWLVGGYSDSAGNIHGFAYIP